MPGTLEISKVQTIEISVDDITNLKQTILELQSKVNSLEITIDNLLNPTFRINDANIQG